MLSSESGSRESSEGLKKDLRKYLMAGVAGFYFINLTALFVGLELLDTLGNVKGLFAFLVLIYLLNFMGYWTVLRLTGER